MKRFVYILCLMCSLLAATGMTGCRRGREKDADRTVLTLYVYTREHPLLTKADVGEVDPTAFETGVSSLQIWVFEHESGDLVGYLSPAVDILDAEKSDVYQMNVSDEFAEDKPSVDVYVLANALENYGLTLSESSTRSQVEAAVMGSSHFGTSPVVSVLPDEGLPMSGVLKNQPVFGQKPVLRIGSESSIATVTLVRTVSKVRFVFTKRLEDDEPVQETVTVNRITLDANVLPEEEYFFLNDAWTARSHRVGATYVNTESALRTDDLAVGTTTDDVQQYAYTDQTAAAYETLIDGGIDGGGLTACGPYYLRESDRRLSGKIYYTVGEREQQSVSFTMSEAGDFSRNHTWIVYGYFYNGDMLEVVAVYISDWTDGGSVTNEIYNW